MKVLNKLLIEWRADPTNKVLIFTKSVKLLDMLDYHLSKNGKISLFLLCTTSDTFAKGFHSSRWMDRRSKVNVRS